MPNPQVNPVILLSPVENGYVAYDPSRDRLHQLNPLAALLAELCDGTRSIDSIRALTAPLMPEDKASEVDRWVEEAIKADLLVWAGDTHSSYREFSAAELHRLAGRLKADGKIQTAYLCEKRVVELSPEDWDAWYDLGDIAQSVGKRDEALVAYQKYFEAHPEDAEIEHLLLALRDAPPPPRASDRTIQQIYKGFASTYESRMLEDLEYKGPVRIKDAILAAIGERTGLSVLDLGCGSGLAGVTLKQWAGQMIGVDLSPEMLELARARAIYDQLEVGEITQWLEQSTVDFDIVATCDCLIYFGDLHAITAAAAMRLKPGGLFVLTTEHGDKFPFSLTDTGRYAHHQNHIRDVAAAAGLAVASLDEGFLRMEYGSPVSGLFAVLVRPVTS